MRLDLLSFINHSGSAVYFQNTNYTQIREACLKEKNVTKHAPNLTGVIVVSSELDREDLSRHLLTIMVRDQGVPSKRSYARVEITVLDHNDHIPHFLSEVITGHVYETAALGTSVVQVMAVDEDKGHNAELIYAVVSGKDCSVTEY